MNWPLLLPVGLRPSDRATASRGRKISQPRTACAFAQLWTFALALLCASALAAQVLTIDTSGKGATADKGPVERKYAQIKPTKVELPKDALDAKTRLLLIRALQSEQGFAMRPFPRGHKGLQLAANGKLEPAGEAYLKMVTHEGLSAKPGERLTITDLKIERAKIVFDLNGGPDAKHRFLRHIQISAGSAANAPEEDSAPDSQANEPVGARLTLSFADRVPALSPEELKALIEPLISFDLKSPIQTFTDALPPPLKEAILAHKVLVGMTAEMALYAKGQPRTKTRERDGQILFEEWIYGEPPDEVDFVRINGNRVIRVEVALSGKPMRIFSTDVVSPMLVASGQSELALQARTHTIKEGDAEIDPDRQAPKAPPSLRNPGEKLPGDDRSNGVMRPVQPPKPHTEEPIGANPDEQTDAPAAAAPQKNSATASSSTQPQIN
jgi:hypothetical protein